MGISFTGGITTTGRLNTTPNFIGISFSPDSISGLLAWLDPSDSENITTISTKVSSIANKAGVNSFTQSNDSRRPVLQSNIFGSLPGIFYDGGSKNLYTSTTYGGQVASTISVFAVTKVAVLTSVSKYILSTRAIVAPDRGWSFYEFSNDVRIYRAGQSSNLEKTHSSLAAKVNWFTKVSSTWVLSYNNQSTVTDTATQVVSTAGTGLGARVPAASGDINYNGHIGEVLIYDSEITGTDRTDILTYLIDKWGVTV